MVALYKGWTKGGCEREIDVDKKKKKKRKRNAWSV